jgi:hypothetical protein
LVQAGGDATGGLLDQQATLVEIEASFAREVGAQVEE